MIAVLILLALFAAAGAAPWLGRDSRALEDGAWSRDALWSRDQSAPSPR